MKATFDSFSCNNENRLGQPWCAWNVYTWASSSPSWFWLAGLKITHIVCIYLSEGWAIIFSQKTTRETGTVVEVPAALHLLDHKGVLWLRRQWMAKPRCLRWWPPSPEAAADEGQVLRRHRKALYLLTLLWPPEDWKSARQLHRSIPTRLILPAPACVIYVGW